MLSVLFADTEDEIGAVVHSASANAVVGERTDKTNNIIISFFFI